MFRTLKDMFFSRLEVDLVVSGDEWCILSSYVSFL